MTTKSRFLVISAVVAVVIALSAAVTVVLLKDDEPVDAATLLSRAQKFVSAQRGVHFEGRLSIEFTDDSVDETITTRTRLEGDTNFTDSHFVVRQGDSYTEVRTIDRVVFERSAESESALRSEQYGEFDLDEEARRAGVVRPGDASGSAETGEPASLPELLRGAQRPRIVSDEDNGRYVVSADVAEAALERLDTEGDATLRLTMHQDGRVDEAQIEVDAEDAEVVGEYTFSRWGTPVKVERPKPSDIDPTPGIYEEDLAEWDDAALYSLRSVPRGWVLEGAYIVTAEESAEDCEQVALDYVDPADPDAGYLYLYEIPVDCDGLDVEPPRGSDPFTAGRYRGWIDESEDGTFGLVIIGDTAIQFEADLDLAALSALLSTLAPLDLAAEPTEVNVATATQSA